MSPWRRTYLVVWIADLITAVGMMSFLPFFPSYLEELGLSDPKAVGIWTGLVFGAAPFVAALMAPVWGTLSDRWGRKLMILRALAAITVFVGCMGLVTEPWQLLVLRLCQGFFSGFIAPSIALVSIGAPKEIQGRVAGDMQTAMAAGAVVGPLIGAFVASEFGMRWVFAVVGLGAGLSGILVWIFAHEGSETRRSTVGRSGVWVSMREDMGKLAANPNLRRAVVLLFAIQFGVGATNPQMELFVRELGYDDPERARELTSILFAVLATTILVATPAWGRHGDRVGHRRAMVHCAVLTALAMFAHAWVGVYLLLVGARIALGFAASGAGPTSYGLAAAETPVERRGGAFGVIFSARALAIAISSMIGGWLSVWLSIRGVFVFGGVLTLVTVLVLSRIGRARDQPADA